MCHFFSPYCCSAHRKVGSLSSKKQKTSFVTLKSKQILMCSTRLYAHPALIMMHGLQLHQVRMT